MGKEQEAAYYNHNLKNFIVPLGESLWKDLYFGAVSIMPADTQSSVLDLGCGTGRLAKALLNSGYNQYRGVDFAAQRIFEARRYVPEADFVVDDIFSAETEILMKRANVIIALELLEHVNDDIKILEKIPKGIDFIFSVPNFDDPAHVRTFKTREDISIRYSNYVDINSISEVRMPNKKSLITRLVGSVKK